MPDAYDLSAMQGASLSADQLYRDHADAGRDDEGRDDGGWLLIMITILMIAPLQWLDPFSITASSFIIPGGFAMLTLGAAAVYRHVRKRDDLAAMFVAITHIIIFTAAGSILSYMLTAQSIGPFWDARLTQWDLAIGFDWHAYLHLIDGIPLLASLYSLAYASLIPQIVMLICALGFCGQVRTMRVAMIAAMLCGLITIIISAFMPALGNLAYFGLSADDFANIDLRAGQTSVIPVTALREGMLRTIDLAVAEGIITFPSYHAGLAMVTLWGFARVPLLRYLGVPLAALTIAATPVNGCHYLVDVIAGIIIAMVSILVAQRVVTLDTSFGVKMALASPAGLSHADPVAVER